MWKFAIVVPVHKKNEKKLKTEYRPISLLPIFGKILEKLAYDPYAHILFPLVFLDPNQSGFRPGDSAINQLISITHSIYKAFECNPPLDARSVYLDISNRNCNIPFVAGMLLGDFEQKLKNLNLISIPTAYLNGISLILRSVMYRPLHCRILSLRFCQQFTLPATSIFGIHDPIGLSHLSQKRGDLSTLNFQK